MPTLDLPGNEALAEGIRQSAARGTLSHAMLFTGPGDRVAAARFVAAAMECTAEEGRPCGVCNACRKVMNEIHPDVITVQDPDHRNLSLEVVRNVRTDAWVQPLEGARKIFLFPDCSLLTEEGQNILLKTVEEGPSSAVFLFCTDNLSAALPTLRSRCVEMKLHPDSAGEQPGDAADGGQTGEAVRKLCQAIGKKGAVTELLLELSQDGKWLSRENVGALMQELRAVAAGAVLGCRDSDSGLHSGPDSGPGSGPGSGSGLNADADAGADLSRVLSRKLDRGRLLHLTDLLQKHLRQNAETNLNAFLLMSALTVELEELA